MLPHSIRAHSCMYAIYDIRALRGITEYVLLLTGVAVVVHSDRRLRPLLVQARTQLGGARQHCEEHVLVCSLWAVA